MAKQAKAALLGSYSVLETDVAPVTMDATTVDSRYRELQRVARDFRKMKTGLLELPPIFLCAEGDPHPQPCLASILAPKVARVGDAAPG